MCLKCIKKFIFSSVMFIILFQMVDYQILKQDNVVMKHEIEDLKL